MVRPQGLNVALARNLVRQAFDSVVVMSPFFWNFHDDMAQTTHHVAREFARMAPTVFVEPPMQWNPRSEQFRLHRLPQNVLGRRVKSPLSNLSVFQRRGLPGGRYAAIREFELARNSRALKGVLTQMGFQRTLLWHSFPYWSEPMVEVVKHELLAYHCLDYSDREEEARFIKRADVVFCVSESLVEKHKRLNPQTYLLPNGVDLTLFSPEAAMKGPRPSDLPSNGRLIGFVGSINCHVDLELIRDVAESFRNDYVVLVGRVLTNETAPVGRQKEALGRLQSLGNVRVLGFKPTSELPLYMGAFDVCLIPFLNNTFNEECDPLKFYQYAAMGKPIVTTPVRAAERYRERCYVRQTREGFIEGIHCALNEPNWEVLRKARLEVARRHSWEAIVAQAWRILEDRVVQLGVEARQ